MGCRQSRTDSGDGRSSEGGKNGAVHDLNSSVTKVVEKEKESMRKMDQKRRSARRVGSSGSNTATKTSGANNALSPNQIKVTAIPSTQSLTRPKHEQGDLDSLSKTSSMASPFLQRMIHTSSSNVMDINQAYEMEGGRILGTGVTGAVRIVKHKITGKEYAHKFLRVSRVRSSRKRKQMYREVEVLKTLDHPNIVKIHEVFEYGNGDLSIVMELCKGDELFEKLLQEKPHYRMLQYDVRRIAFKMFSALNYLHLNNLVHRDIKLENFMFTSNDKDGDLKLLDFGFSRTYLQGENIKNIAGTPYTMSPEVFKRCAGPPADVWAIGVCIYVLLYGRRPFRGRNRHEIQDSVMLGTFEWQKELPGFEVGEDVKDLITLCLNMDPEKRITAAAALKHPFFAEDIRSQNVPHRLDVLTMAGPSIEDIGNTIDSLWAFSRLGRLRKTVFLAVSQSMSSSEISKLNTIFEEMDMTNDGTIGFVELTHVLRRYCEQAAEKLEKSGQVSQAITMPSDEEVRFLFEGLDQDGSGLIKYSEFIAACLEQNHAYSDALIADAFHKMDLDNSGEITKDNLMNLMRTASGDAGMSDEQVEETVERMLSEGDVKGDGVISLEELQQVMRMQAPTSDRIRAGKNYDRSESAESLARVEFEDVSKLKRSSTLKHLSSISEDR